MTSPQPSISGLADLAGRYDAVLSDVWGVVHNGVEAFPSAVEALAEFRKAGGKDGPINALRELGKPSDVLLNTKARLFAA